MSNLQETTDKKLSNAITTIDFDKPNKDSKTARQKRAYIPYGTIYLSLNVVRKEGYWIPFVPISAKIIEVEKDTSSYHLFNPFLYTIQLEHGRYNWTVKKCYQDFTHLFNRLLAHKAVEKIKDPMRRARIRLHDALENNENDKDKEQKNETYNLNKLCKESEFDNKNEVFYEDYDENFIDGDQEDISELTLLNFPLLPDLMIAEENINERKERLETWIHTILSIPIYRDYHETTEFFEVSRFSFVNELGGKYKEGIIKKRSGGNKVYIGCKQFCFKWILPWNKRWFILKDTYVFYLNPSNENICLVLLFDEQFEINSDNLSIVFTPNELYLSNLQHVLAIKFNKESETLNWITTINNALKNTGEIWLKKKKFGSTFPPRSDNYCQWFIDAKDCWEKIALMIEMSREEIFIAGWWLCSEIFLKRPMVEGNRWRLDYLLKQKAEKGVKIFILIYKEMEMVIGLKSIYFKHIFQNLHPNIKVMRHPDHFFGTGTFFWAHHEKIVIIDQLVAFVGGLDLCYGRWDDSRHVLTDLGSIKFLDKTANCSNEEITETNINANKNDNGDVKETIKTNETELNFTPKNKFKKIIINTMHRKNQKSLSLTPEIISSPRNIFDEIQDQIKKPSFDNKTNEYFYNKATHNENNNNYYLNDNILNKTSALTMEPKNRTVVRRVVSNLRSNKVNRLWRTVLDHEDTTNEYDLNYCRFQHSKVDMTDLQGAGKLWLGKDYVNYLVKDFVNIHEAYNDFINRCEIPRTPWHDIHSVVYGKAARDVARHFIQRWNATKTEKLKSNNNYPYLIPKSYNSIRVPKIFLNKDTHLAEVQVLRSASHWSVLIDKNEDSIQQAYLSLIANAKHYIYIENQFFVSLIDSSDVTNEICRVLCQRITRAYKKNEVFRVIIIIPLLPGFEGDIGSSYSSLLAVLHWTMRSISNGPHSLLENLKKNGVKNPENYIIFCSLRNHDELAGKLVTEMIYVHSKLMIVDDLYTIIGSANINDRSQVGNRDSEVCVLITDQKFVNSKMNGKSYLAGEFAFSLRKRLMSEHLGLLDDSFHKTAKERAKQINLDDPISDEFFINVWSKSAADNTKIYEEIFKCYPTDLVTKFTELVDWRAEKPLALQDIKKAKEKLKKLVGNLVQFPTQFLKHENLSPTITSKEGLVPSAVFT